MFRPKGQPLPTPAAPTNLDTSAGDSQVTLSWDDPGDSTITRYEVRCPNPLVRSVPRENPAARVSDREAVRSARGACLLASNRAVHILSEDFTAAARHSSDGRKYSVRKAQRRVQLGTKNVRHSRLR